MAVFGGEEADGEGVVFGEVGAVEADTNFALDEVLVAGEIGLGSGSITFWKA